MSDLFRALGVSSEEVEKRVGDGAVGGDVHPGTTQRPLVMFHDLSKRENKNTFVKIKNRWKRTWTKNDCMESD